MGLTLAATEAQEHGGVDDRDTFLHRVRDLLNIHTGIIPVFPTYQQVMRMLIRSGTHSHGFQLFSLFPLLEWDFLVRVWSPFLSGF